MVHKLLRFKQICCRISAYIYMFMLGSVYGSSLVTEYYSKHSYFIGALIGELHADANARSLSLYLSLGACLIVESE